MVDFTDDDNVYKALNAKVNVAKFGVSNGTRGVTSYSLSQKWLILPEAARRTVQHTIQQGIRKIMHPSLSQIFKTNDRALRYNRLHHSVFVDTIQAATLSKRRNWYAQLYSTRFFWSVVHPIKSKGGAHKTLSLLFKRYGVPPKMVMDESK